MECVSQEYARTIPVSLLMMGVGMSYVETKQIFQHMSCVSSQMVRFTIVIYRQAIT